MDPVTSIVAPWAASAASTASASTAPLSAVHSASYRLLSSAPNVAVITSAASGYPKKTKCTNHGAWYQRRAAGSEVARSRARETARANVHDRAA